MSKHLEEQIERIADEARGGKCRVIVQMQANENLSEYLESTAEAIEHRRSLVSARDLVPPARDVIKTTPAGAMRRETQRKLARSTLHSAPMFLAQNLMPHGRATEDLMRSSRHALEPLFKSTIVKRSLERKKRARTKVPTHFWASSSAVLELTKDELKTLAKEVPTVSDVFPNRLIRVPPVAKSTKLPLAVEDNKCYTWGIAKTGAMAVWGAFDARGDGVKVAVLDTGVDPTHPDLVGKIAGFAEFSQNGEVMQQGIKKAYDSDSHGTHCAGIIVGGNASERRIGMAPSAKILAGLVLPKGAGTDAQILAGMEWAMKEGADVISLSLGGLRMTADVVDTYTRTIINANRLGIPVVVAIGNEGSQTSGSPGNDYFAFSVGATDINDLCAGFSGGRTQIIEKSRYIDTRYLPIVYSKPDVTAPGVDVYSSVPGSKKWEAWNGTSMATPHVAAAMALLLSGPLKIGELQGEQRVTLLQTLLTSTVKELGESGQNHRFGYGRIDVLRAYGYAVDLGY